MRRIFSHVIASLFCYRIALRVSCQQIGSKKGVPLTRDAFSVSCYLGNWVITQQP